MLTGLQRQDNLSGSKTVPVRGHSEERERRRPALGGGGSTVHNPWEQEGATIVQVQPNSPPPAPRPAQQDLVPFPAEEVRELRDLLQQQQEQLRRQQQQQQQREEERKRMREEAEAREKHQQLEQQQQERFRDAPPPPTPRRKGEGAFAFKVCAVMNLVGTALVILLLVLLGFFGLGSKMGGGEGKSPSDQCVKVVGGLAAAGGDFVRNQGRAEGEKIILVNVAISLRQTCTTLRRNRSLAIDEECRVLPSLPPEQRRWNRGGAAQSGGDSHIYKSERSFDPGEHGNKNKLFLGSYQAKGQGGRRTGLR